MAVSPIAATVPAFAKSSSVKTQTPIEHIVLIIGENHTFDNLYGTYIPKKGETVDNILSRKIINADGSPGVNFAKAAQMQSEGASTYEIAPTSKTSYSKLPAPALSGTPAKASDTDPAPFATLEAVEDFEKLVGNNGLDRSDWQKLTTGASGLSSSGVDTRITNANNLPNGPFQFTGASLLTTPMSVARSIASSRCGSRLTAPSLTPRSATLPAVSTTCFRGWKSRVEQAEMELPRPPTSPT